MLPKLRPLLVVAFLLLAVSATAASQDERFRERQVLDPVTGEWLDDAPALDGDPLNEARALLVEERPDRARRLLQHWLRENRDDDRYYEGVFLLGEAYFLGRDFWAAAKQYEIVADSTAGELFMRAVERTMDVARAFLAGEKRIVWGFLRLPAYDDGIELLDRAWSRVPGTRLGELALKLKADYFYERGDFAAAQDEYALLVREYPNGQYARVAMLRAAESANAMFRSPRHDDRPLIEAAERYEQLQGAYPEYAAREGVEVRLVGIRESRAAKDLLVGQWYARTGQPQAAAFYYRLVLRDWPDTRAAVEAQDGLRDLGYLVDDETQETQP